MAVCVCALILSSQHSDGDIDVEGILATAHSTWIKYAAEDK
jgi:hypothetical protein